MPDTLRPSRFVWKGRVAFPPNNHLGVNRTRLALIARAATSAPDLRPAVPSMTRYGTIMGGNRGEEGPNASPATAIQ